MRTFDIDQPAGFKAEVTDEDGNLVDPPNPLWRVLTPSGDLAEPKVEHPSTGIFKGSFEHDEPGVHRALYKGDLPHKIGGEIEWRVRAPKVPRD